MMNACLSAPPLGLLLRDHMLRMRPAGPGHGILQCTLVVQEVGSGALEDVLHVPMASSAQEVGS